ncbi:polymer-forming cytoskeletal protein [Pseudomonas sp. KSR10]|uniref:Cell shape determination protein CcmA n=1 Tax=Stutzerimonas stutzeri TaxID=316 RepID=A0A0D9AH96_STUST|nr:MULTISPECIES: polymer-forming cytoskeletal protein [Pseudomonadaceae]KJH80084.1 cell shape determination protein CcmA [Stutzerimonas stutzeri]MCG6539940.1 polymer-forming cytoskeletal protein [Pseudomonas sp. KSR10]
MFNKKKAVRVSIDQFSSLISSNVSLIGDMEFEEGLKVSGTVKGNVCHKPGTHSLLALSTDGRIEGNVSSYDALIDGTVVGDMVVEHLLELHSNARVRGNIRYRQLSMENGAVVDGTLNRMGDEETAQVVELPRLQVREG